MQAFKNYLLHTYFMHRIVYFVVYCSFFAPWGCFFGLCVLRNKAVEIALCPHCVLFCLSGHFVQGQMDPNAKEIYCQVVFVKYSAEHFYKSINLN